MDNLSNEDLESIKPDSRIDSTSKSNTKFEIQKAKLEESELFRKDVSANNEHTHKEGIRRNVYKAAKWMLWALWGVAIILISTRVLHLILPIYCRWVPADDIKEMDKLFNYVIIGAVGTHALKYYQKKITED